ncbi:MAG: hypothetical protein GTN36_01375 [Candidatus Aenigmarchaeota archaeon]|nr:hypothetical protein [Candidatus Aenigmarchaeota archaeon]
MSDSGEDGYDQPNQQSSGNKFSKLFNETRNPNQGMNPMGQMGPMGPMNQAQPNAMSALFNQNNMSAMSAMTPMGLGPDSPMTPMGPMPKNNYFTNSVEQNILNRLPDGYNGVLPDVYQYNLPMPGDMGMGMGMGMDMPMNMSNFNLPPSGTSLPQPGLDPMQLKSMITNGMEPGMTFSHEAGMDQLPSMSNMGNDVMPALSMTSPMGNDVASMLPDHLKMQSNQTGGRQKKFFF